MKRTSWLALSPSLLALSLLGCSESGSEPVEFPEVTFRVQRADGSGGRVSFVATSLTAGGTSRGTSLDNTEFTATGEFNIVFENAPPPYSGTFMRGAESADIAVTLSVSSATSQTQVTDFTTADKQQAMVMIGGPATTPIPAATELRFDVCAPSSGATTCFVPGDSGIPAVGFTGTLGDNFDSHLTSGLTPSIYFLENARDSANAVFTRSPTTGDVLMVQFYINGAISETQIGSGDIVIQKDL